MAQMLFEIPHARRPLVAAFAGVGIALLGCTSTTKVYRDSWQPVSAQYAPGLPRLVVNALLIEEPQELDALQACGGTFIGWHAASRGFAIRAGSVGGTHFVPVAQDGPSTRASCYSWANTTICSAREREGAWTRVAVFRLEPDRWHLLPPHLIPPEEDVVSQGATSVRTGCGLPNKHYGTVRCRNDWAVSSR